MDESAPQVPRSLSLTGMHIPVGRDYTFLKQACEDAGVPCLGYMLRNRDLIIPGRHLGLTIEAREETEKLISLAAKEVEQHVNLDAL